MLCFLVLASQVLFIAPSLQLDLAEQRISADGSLTLLDAEFRTPCEPATLPLKDVFLGVLPLVHDRPYYESWKTVWVLQPLPTKRSNNFKIGMQECGADTCLKSKENRLSITEIGKGKVRITYSNEEDDLCLSVAVGKTSKKAFFLPCNQPESNKTKIINSFQMGKDLMVDASTSLLSIIVAQNKLTWPNGNAFRILGSSETCKMPRSNDECKAKNAALPIFDKGVCRAQVIAECPEDQNVINGTCQAPTNLAPIENCAEAPKFNKTLNKAACAKCNPTFVPNEQGVCVKGCPPGQFMLHDKDTNPVLCHDLRGNKPFKLLIHGDKMNAYLGQWREGKWGGGESWGQNTFRNDANYGDALVFRAAQGNRLYVKDTDLPVSTLYYPWRDPDGAYGKMWTIKTHGDHPDRHLLELSTINNGLLARIGEKGRDRAHECVMEAPEGTIKYGYTVAECGPDAFPHYSFLIVI